MQNVERFIAEVNAYCDDGEFYTGQTLGSFSGWTDEELAKLDEELDGISFEQIAEDYDDARSLPPIVIAAFERLVGPFEVTHKDYDPYWFRTIVPLQEPECERGECPTCNEEAAS